MGSLWGFWGSDGLGDGWGVLGIGANLETVEE